MINKNVHSVDKERIVIYGHGDNSSDITFECDLVSKSSVLIHVPFFPKSEYNSLNLFLY